ncbi:hypothetical protein KC19_11G099700 [Ceratodon purpureus]|uniref:TF-B3 domain-containing protein n=2 Tax=Ceratodon purpureus TaxID=3225 RepID=A0A8T0GGZ9_CERPU|nr:hypothetical protein KC19_11G099700 [Ceratodon purpureus]
MDVVNGKIVSARSERASAEAWSALTPSRGRTVEGGHGNLEQVRGNGCEWAPSWATQSSFSDENPLNAWGVACQGSMNSLGLEAGAARWSQWPEKHHSGAARHEYTGLQPRPVAEHRQGWGNVQRHCHGGARPWSLTKLDQMMDMYESQMTRGAVPEHVAATAGLGQESPGLSLPLEKFKERSGTDVGFSHENEAQCTPTATLVCSHSDLKRKRLEIIICDDLADEAEQGWSHPLKLLFRKGLSVSDVGELGRIIIPKRYAESKFEQVDTKEGTLLQMEDYNGSKQWFFRFKWWINNKSRMYVLENTGEFIKYHGLKENDIFIVYADSSKKMVVRGHKGTDLDSTLDVFQGINAASSSEKAPFIRDEGLITSTMALV